jgi:hypothetical protein
VVSVILINEAFEYVAKGPCLSKWSPSGKGLLLGGLLMSHRIAPTHTCHFSCLFPCTSSSFGFSGHIDPRRACTSFHGKKGLKA